jgi:hypothetical protein
VEAYNEKKKKSQCRRLQQKHSSHARCQVNAELTAAETRSQKFRASGEETKAAIIGAGGQATAGRDEIEDEVGGI